MEAIETLRGGVPVIALRGEVDLAVSPRLRELLKEKSSAKCPALVLDLSEVSYVDSSGLATLVEYCREARQFGGKFGLAGLQPRVRTILEIVRLHEFLPLHATVEEAVRAAVGDGGGAA